MKNRVKTVLNYKKPAFWIIVVAVIASVAVAVCFLTNPRTTIDDELSVFLDMQIAEHHYSEGHSIYYDEKSFCAHVTETTNAEEVDTAMAGWFITVAVSDELIKNCTEFDADLNNGTNG